jgi:hypothetical protein
MSSYSQAPVVVVHAYNPIYSEDRDQEDSGSKPAPANSLRDPILNSFHKGTGGVAQGVGPKFKLQYHKHTQKSPVSSQASVSLLWIRTTGNTGLTVPGLNVVASNPEWPLLLVLLANLLASTILPLQ